MEHRIELSAPPPSLEGFSIARVKQVLAVGLRIPPPYDLLRKAKRSQMAEEAS